jgi:dihydroxyacid dehydratase/phosphogluconate dehydratase
LTVLRILRGNLAPGGAVAKITGKEGLYFEGKARVFDTEDDFVAAIENKSIKKGEKTVISVPGVVLVSYRPHSVLLFANSI